MLLSTETSGLRLKYDDKIAIKMIKDAGFDAFDGSLCYMKGQPEKDLLDDNYIERAKELRAYADEIGIVCNQTHAPLDFQYTDETDLSNENFLRNVRAIEVSSILGAKSIIFHGLGIVYAHDIDYIEYNTKYLRSYLPYCEKYNMKISYENSCAISKDMKAIPIPGVHTAEEYMRFIDSLDNRWFNICVDTGHLAAMDASCRMEVTAVQGAKNIFFGGEGLFHTVITGPGRIYLQTMPIVNVANAIRPYIPTKSD